MWRNWSARSTIPWEKWTVFLHPAQRQLVERDYSGPARVSGSAGTGKTIVALHRAVFLARANPDAPGLAHNVLRHAGERAADQAAAADQQRAPPGRTLEVHAMNAIGRRLYEVERWPADRSHHGKYDAGTPLQRPLPRLTATSSPAFLDDRVGTGGGRLAVGHLGAIATSRGWAERRGCRRSSERCCGRSSSACRVRLKRRGLITDSEHVQSAGVAAGGERASAV